jgi:hypothetical protein
MHVQVVWHFGQFIASPYGMGHPYSSNIDIKEAAHHILFFPLGSMDSSDLPSIKLYNFWMASSGK